MFEDALRYPAEGDDALTTIAIGGILGLLGVFVLPALIVYGHLVRVIRAVSEGDDEIPPVFEEWRELLMDGLRALLVTLVYTLVPTLLLTIAVAPVFVISSVTVNGDGGGGVTAVGALILLLVLAVGVLGLIAVVAAVYVVPAAVTAFATTGRLGAAFSVSELRSIGGSGQFVTGWLVAVVISVLVGTLAGVVAATVVGALLVPFLNFYGNVAAAYALGAGARERNAGESTVGESEL